MHRPAAKTKEPLLWGCAHHLSWAPTRVVSGLTLSPRWALWASPCAQILGSAVQVVRWTKPLGLLGF